MSRAGDTGAALVRALRHAFGGFELIERRDAPWASVTFQGARHRLVLAMPDDRATRLMDRIAEVELPLPGHLVADIAALAEAAGEGTRVTVEALVLEAA